MKRLNFSTAEELVFQDTEVQKLLPPYMFSYFEQWRLGFRVPMLRQMAKQAILDFLDQLNDEHIQILEKHFGEQLVVEKLNYRSVENYKIPLSETKICEALCEIEFQYFSTWRDAEYLYISFWR